MRKWLSETVARGRAASRRGAAPGSGDIPNESDLMQNHETVEDVLDKKGAGRKLLCRAATLIEYSLLISVVSLVVVTAGPPVAEAIQGQFTKVANVISNGSTGSTGGGSDFPGGGSGGGSGSDQGGTDDKTDSDGDGIPDSQDKYPNDPNNGNGDKDGDGIPDKDDVYPDDPNNGVKPDADGDGIPDSEDAYPNDPNNGTGDRDGDGIMDKDDQYPDDPLNGKKPSLTGSVSISNCIVGVKSTPSVSGTQDDASLTYSWFVDDAHVSDSQSYTFSPSQKGLSAYVVVKAANGDYDGEIRSNSVVVTARDLASVMSATMSTPVVGQQVSVNISQQPSDAVLGYSWMVDGAVVSTSSSYVPVKNDANKTLTVQITDKSGIYDGNVVATQTVSEPAKPRLTGELEISNATVGTTSAVFATDIPGNAEIEYVWYIDGVQAGTGTSHRFEAADKGKSARVIGTDKSGTYSGSIKSNIIAIGIRNITGTVTFDDPKVGTTVTANVSGTPSDATIAYSWKIDGKEVGTASTFKPTSAQTGKVLSVEVYDSAGIYDHKIASTGKTILAQGVGDVSTVTLSQNGGNDPSASPFGNGVTYGKVAWLKEANSTVSVSQSGAYTVRVVSFNGQVGHHNQYAEKHFCLYITNESSGTKANIPLATALLKKNQGTSASVSINNLDPITVQLDSGDYFELGGAENYEGFAGAYYHWGGQVLFEIKKIA